MLWAPEIHFLVAWFTNMKISPEHGTMKENVCKWSLAQVVELQLNYQA